MKTTKKVELVQEQLEQANLPERFWQLDMSKFKGEKYAIDVVRRYCSKLKEARKRGTGLFCQGGHESGKTLFACNVLVAALAEGFSAKYFTLPEIMDGLFSRTVVTKDIVSPDFLVLDNVNADTNSASDSVLRRVLFARKDSGKPLVLCTRLDDKQFVSAYSEESLDMLARFCQRLPSRIDSREVIRQSDRSKDFLVDADHAQDDWGV